MFLCCAAFVSTFCVVFVVVTILFVVVCDICVARIAMCLCAGVQGLATVWHGTSESIALKIASNGFVNVKFNPSDKGYFGSGIYVTPQPRYAAAYVTGKLLVSGWVMVVC